DLSLQPVQVKLDSYYNAVGITTPGTADQPGLDAASDSYSYNALGSTVTWNSQTFNLGTRDQNDVVIAGGQSIYVPPGNYTGIELLGTTAGYNQTIADPFRLDYAGSTADSYIQGVSD